MAAESSQRWIGTWATALTRPNPGLVPSWAEEGFEAQTLRQVVRISAGGKAVRLTLSNYFGATPLRLAGVTVALSGGGARVLPGTLHHVTFDGARAASVPAGGELVSDAVRMPVRNLESLTVTAYLPERTGPATYHSWAGATSYRAPGDHRTAVPGDAFTETTQSWYYLAGVDALSTSRHAGTVATFGDSITDGYASTPDANNRYPDELAELRRSLGVLNLGISGNRLLSDSPCLGESGVGRFARDVLTKPGLRAVVVQHGINDIGSRGTLPCIGEVPIITAQDLIEGHRDVIRQARAHGLTVIGGTLLPYKGAAYYRAEGEAIREEVNAWIRSSGEFDAVVDFGAVLADPQDIDQLNPAYDSGDHLHPNDAGYRAMGEAVHWVLDRALD
ncbi:SGNH/GDSL hydrolase family protein [Solwaraspora sp. WMMD1047]|uniref:SGNH/GDSL hydrolase family protein n=1 Tax=Solwaraspora sp. WMMD1047 TaxID=3016102 RepID=UPI0024160144|nr:SGNH/GDSL hydrolase family protein [Solwaraspora sp. WMMD1047]MDG4830624.1 SGNH/GDSL hydrolase family protein [Solwaraspora sp. WMMD1047]